MANQMKLFAQRVSYLIILCVIVIRFGMTMLPLNYDYPDEYWQGPEIAYSIYNKVINNISLGYETWQWTMKDPIRNPIFQFILAFGYIIAHFLILLIKYIQQNYGLLQDIEQQHFDTLMQISPKVIQSIIAIIGDIYVIKLLYFYFGKKSVTSFSLVFILSNWFYLTMLSRTYINSFQCVMMAVGFYYWQLHHYQNHFNTLQSKQTLINTKYDFISRVIVLISYVARPTSIIPWIIIWPFELVWSIYTKYNSNKCSQQNKIVYSLINLGSKIILKNIFQIIIMLGCSIIVGTLYFGKFVLTEWNFFYYNLVQKWSDLFDIHSWHFYFSVSIPMIQTGYILFLFIGLLNGLLKKENVQNLQLAETTIKSRQYSNLCYMSIIFLIVLSLISSHKQHRFLMLLMPFILIINFSGFIRLKQSLFTPIIASKLKKFGFGFLIFMIIIINLLAFRLIAIQDKGGFDILRKIRQQVNQQILDQMNQRSKSKIGVMYLCQAHVLPAYSILLKDIQLILIDESPLAKIQNRSQITLLKKNPQEVFNQLNKHFKGVDQNKNKNDVLYLILNQKYTEHSVYPDIGNSLERKSIQQIRRSLIISQKWQFIQQDYELIMAQNNRNMIQQLIFGIDLLYLYKKIDYQKQY